jgi:hypothetical protein
LCAVCRRTLVDATGTTRRLQALGRAGYSSGWITRELAISRQVYVRWWRAGKRPRLWVVHQRLVGELYDQLWDSDGPSAITRTWALRYGWEPYEAWTMETIDDPKAQAWAVLQDPGYIDEVLLDKVRAGVVPFMALNRAEQTVLLLEYLASGGGIRGFRDRYRPVPIGVLREIAAQQKLEVPV